MCPQCKTVFKDLLWGWEKTDFLLGCSKDVRLPVQLQRAMAAEAEAAREARAKVRCVPISQNDTVHDMHCKWDSNVFFF